MIAIRPEQYASFQKAATDDFLARGLKHVRERFPEQTAPFTDDALRARFKAGISRAYKYGLTAEWDIVRFVDASLLLKNESFDEQLAWSKQLLTSPLLTPDEKAGLILQLAADEAPRAGNVATR